MQSHHPSEESFPERPSEAPTDLGDGREIADIFRWQVVPHRVAHEQHHRPVMRDLVQMKHHGRWNLALAQVHGTSPTSTDTNSPERLGERSSTSVAPLSSITSSPPSNPSTRACPL